ncbi:hypothetical protein AC579_4441 [Pseudocercospora musae]|uniref:Uncharacterized protein n=1 Tax=Pseudocercospora musae TaxID=113226 RepID=A0A139I440_9PEZI|nr:hypothetical protein AC579_4441 [Pseudocercospora musae]
MAKVWMTTFNNVAADVSQQKCCWLVLYVVGQDMVRLAVAAVFALHAGRAATASRKRALIHSHVGAIGRGRPSSSRCPAQFRGAGIGSLINGSSLPDLQGVWLRYSSGGPAGPEDLDGCVFIGWAGCSLHSSRGCYSPASSVVFPAWAASRILGSVVVGIAVHALCVSVETVESCSGDATDIPARQAVTVGP